MRGGLGWRGSAPARAFAGDPIPEGEHGLPAVAMADLAFREHDKSRGDALAVLRVVVFLRHLHAVVAETLDLFRELAAFEKPPALRAALQRLPDALGIWARVDERGETRQVSRIFGREIEPGIQRERDRIAKALGELPPRRDEHGVHADIARGVALAAGYLAAVLRERLAGAVVHLHGRINGAGLLGGFGQTLGKVGTVKLTGEGVGFTNGNARGVNRLFVRLN